MQGCAWHACFGDGHVPKTTESKHKFAPPPRFSLARVFVAVVFGHQNASSSTSKQVGGKVVCVWLCCIFARDHLEITAWTDERGIKQHSPTQNQLTSMPGRASGAMQPYTVFLAGLVCFCSSGITASAAVGIPPDIRFTDQTYRKYVGTRDKQKPWHNTADVLTKRGYAMSAVQVRRQPGRPGVCCCRLPHRPSPPFLLLCLQSDIMDGSIATALGPMRLSADAPFVRQDLHAAYGLDTIWPYCQSVSKCLVYVQQDSPTVKKAPITLTLPPGASAVDFYIDAAIDCVVTTRAVVKCKAVVQPGAVEVKFSVNSVCASPFVGKYVGFFDESGDSIDSVTLTCKSTVPTAIGLLRVGAKQRAAAAVAAQVPDPA